MDSMRVSEAAAIIGVAEDCSESELKNAYRALARVHHPDKVEEEKKEDAVVKFQQIGAAHMPGSMPVEQYTPRTGTKGPGVSLAYPGQPFGEGGVLHYVGTRGGTAAWTNPHTAGLVVAAAANRGPRSMR